MIYLNNAATTFPKPSIVTESVNQYLNTAPLNFARTGLKDKIINHTAELRNTSELFFECDDIYHSIITSGSTESLNLAIRGFEFSECNIITTQTEHNSVLRILSYLERYNVETKIAHCDGTGFVSPADISKLIDSQTKAIIINHCSNVTGVVQDLPAISKIAKENNLLLIVDASQSAGVINFSFKDFTPDAIAVTGHKSLYGIQGIGMLFLNKKHNITPLKFGGTGTMSYLTIQPEEFPYKYESGTLNYPGIVALNAGINWIMQTGLDKIIKRKKELWNKIYDNLILINRINIYFSENSNSFGVFSMNINGIKPDEVNFILESSFGIAVRSGLHCSPLTSMALGCYPDGTLRISPSYFTTDEEISIFIDAIIKICRTNIF